MLQRGRKSASSLSVIATFPDQRPEPLSDLTDEQKVEWRAIVASMPPDWFRRETWPMLGQLCSHIVTSRGLRVTIAAFDPALLKDDEGVARYDRLTKMHE